MLGYWDIVEKTEEEKTYIKKVSFTQGLWQRAMRDHGW